MKIKKLLVMGILAATVLCACSGNNNANGVNSENATTDVYAGDGLSVKLANELTEVQFSTKEWEAITLENAISDNDLIFKGTIDSVEEILINANGQNQGYRKLIQVTPVEIFKDTNEVIDHKQPIKLVIPVSTRDYNPMVADLEEGRQCVFLAKSYESIQGDAVDYSKFCDAVVTSPIECVIPVISKKVYLVREIYRDMVEESTSFMQVVNTYSSYSDISTYLYNGESIPEFTSIVSLSDMDDMYIKDTELLWSFVNKNYDNEDGFIRDIETLYLTSESMFKEGIESYLGK